MWIGVMLEFISFIFAPLARSNPSREREGERERGREREREREREGERESVL
jgi:hypothetical protein